MDYIRYIDKTHEYYRAQGYDKTYNYAYNEDIPFTPLKKPLSECRVTLVTTAAFLLLDEEGLPLEEPRMLGTNELEVFTAPSDWPAGRILSTSEDHDRYQTDMTDVNAYFPIERLREFLAEGACTAASIILNSTSSPMGVWLYLLMLLLVFMHSSVFIHNHIYLLNH